MNWIGVLARESRLTLPEIIPCTLEDTPRKALSLILKYAQIGLTWETVVIFVDVPTRSPIWEFDTPAMPSIGELTLVQARFNSAFFSLAFSANTCAAAASRLAVSLSSCFCGIAYCAANGVSRATSV